MKFQVRMPGRNEDRTVVVTAGAPAFEATLEDAVLTGDALEVRDGLIFDDRDWSSGVLLGRPQDVATCAVAINELTGTAPQQPGGFAH